MNIGIRYTLARDGNAHWHVVEADHVVRFNALAEKSLTDYGLTDGEIDEMERIASPVGGGPNLVTFTDPVIR